jgi:effector protein B
MLIYEGVVLHKEEEKQGGKNQHEVNGFYEGRDGSKYSRYFIKKPSDPRELFTELFAGLLLEEFKRCDLVGQQFHNSLICCHFIKLEDGTYALIQPRIDFIPLYHIIGTGYADGSDRNPFLEMIAGPSYYPLLTQVGHYFGLATSLMFSLLLGDYSVHSGNVGCFLNEDSFLSSSSSGNRPAPIQFTKIDAGASFRFYCHPDNNMDILTPYEYKGVRSHRGITKGYVMNYRDVPGLFPSIASRAKLLKESVTEEHIFGIVLRTLRKIPPDLLDDETKRQLADYLFLDSFREIRFDNDESLQQVARDLTKILMRRLDRIATLSYSSPKVDHRELRSKLKLTVTKETPFPALMQEWKRYFDCLVESPFEIDIKGFDMEPLYQQFNHYVAIMAHQAEVFNLWHHDEDSNTNHLAAYFNQDQTIHHGSAFVPHYRESALLRRFYTVDPQGKGVVRLHHYDLANKEFLKVQGTFYWNEICNTLNAGLGVINALETLKKMSALPLDANSLKLQQDQLHQQLQLFEGQQARLLNQLKQEQSRIKLVDFGSHFFYYLSDDELDGMSGAQLATMCLEELNVTEPSPLIVRIINNTERWQRLCHAFESGDFDVRADKTGKWHLLITWRLGLEQFMRLRTEFQQAIDLDAKNQIILQLQAVATSLPECFLQELAKMIHGAQEELDHERQLLTDYTDSLTRFEQASSFEKIQLNPILQEAFQALPPELKPLYQISATRAEREVNYLQCLLPNALEPFDNLRAGFELLTPEIQRRYTLSYQTLQSTYQGLRDKRIIEQDFPVSELNKMLNYLQSELIPPEVQNKLLQAALSDKVIWDVIYSNLDKQAISLPVWQDVLTLKEFCDRKLRLNQNNDLGTEYSDSIRAFYKDVVDIRLSDAKATDQTDRMLQSAHEHFQPRHSTRRLIADFFLVLSCCVGVGFLIGGIRKFQNKTFFFSQMVTDRETEFSGSWLKKVEDGTVDGEDRLCVSPSF